METKAQLASQWRNPSDIFSLSLLIGGDVVQRAISQLFGFDVRPFQRAPRLYLTPVAFSFGWVGYAFTSLASVISDKQLIPLTPENSSVIINCSSGYRRFNRSWLLERILRDHELAVEQTPSPKHASSVASSKRISLRIDIFNASQSRRPKIDHVWIFGWLAITIQLGVSIAPWVRYGDWGVFLVTASGTAFALMTGSLRQWQLEKWPGRQLNDSSQTKRKTKTVCLTRGNGHKYAMVLISDGTGRDLESLATATSKSLVETPWLLGVLAVLWSCLLITASGLKQNSWFLVLVGGIGMVQNIYAAAATRSPDALNVKLTPYAKRPVIVGLGFDWPHDDENSDEDLNDNTHGWRQELDYWMVPGVRGAIRELEKTFPKAGVALMQEFFPALIKYEPERYRTNAEKKFWKKAFREIGMPVPSKASGST